MSEVKRRYDTSSREAEARRRRDAMVAAAAQLFRSAGFAGTTIASVAEAADVSVETVYRVFGSKAVLAKWVFDHAIAGDSAAVAIADRPEAQAVREEPDPSRKIDLYVTGFVQRQHRSAWIQILIRDAGHGDEAAAALWRTMLDERLAGMSALGSHLIDGGGLRPGLRLSEVRDVLWTCTAIELYELLVVHRRWSLDRYRQWITGMLKSALL